MKQRRWPVIAARAGYGAALLCAPRTVIRLCTGGDPSLVTLRVARILGLRHLAQASLSAAPAAAAAGVAGPVVDVLHAASMLALATANRGPRRAELADSAVELALAVASCRPSA